MAFTRQVVIAIPADTKEETRRKLEAVAESMAASCKVTATGFSGMAEVVLRARYAAMELKCISEAYYRYNQKEHLPSPNYRGPQKKLSRGGSLKSVRKFR